MGYHEQFAGFQGLDIPLSPRPQETVEPEVDSSWFRTLRKEQQVALADIDNRNGIVLGTWVDEEIEIQEKVLALLDRHASAPDAATKKVIEKDIVRAFSN